MTKKLISSLVVSFVVCTQMIQAAYNPFKTEAIKVTNTALANANVTPQAEFNNINTTALINTDTSVFISVTSNGVVCIPGTYLVDITMYQTASVTRGNTSIEVTVDSVGTGIIGANGYIRNGSGHNESSTSVSDLVTLTSVSKIGFDVFELANSGNMVVPAGQSSMRITRMKD